MNIQLQKNIVFKDLSKIFLRNKVNYLLFYRTLLYAKKVGRFNEDNEDNVIIYTEEKKIPQIKEILKKKKFKFYRIDRDSFKIKKLNVNIEIFIVLKSQSSFFFKNIEIETKYLLKKKKIKILGTTYFLPAKSNFLISKIFSPKKIELIKNMIFSNKKIFSKIIDLVILFLLIIKYKKSITNYSLKNKFNALSNIQFKNFPISNKIKQKGCKVLTEKEFKNTYFDFDKSNWIYRKPHLSIFTNSTKIKKIGPIINHIRKNFKKIKSSIKEVDTSKTFDEPLEWNDNFWKKGNNFFIYSIIYEYRHGVVAYNQSNKYIRENQKLKLYSKKYFESLKSMSDKEIKNYLDQNPLKLIDNAFSEGRHKVAAMIGRLVKNKKYIPFHVYI